MLKNIPRASFSSSSPLFTSTTNRRLFVRLGKSSPSLKQQLFHVSVTNKNDQGDTLDSFVQSARVLQLKQHLHSLGKASIPKSEFLRIANEKADLSESEAIELLRHFHESATFCNFENSPTLANDVILKPETVLHQIYKTIQPTALKEQAQELQNTIIDLHSQITPLLKQKVQLDKKANKSLNTRIWMGLGYLSAQTAFLAKLTWIDYGWDVVEPITYFVTFTTAIISYIYFTFRKKDYSYEHAMRSWLERRRVFEYSKTKFPIDKLHTLQLEYDRSVQRLLQLNVDLYGQIDGQKIFEEQMEQVNLVEHANTTATATANP